MVLSTLILVRVMVIMVKLADEGLQVMITYDCGKGDGDGKHNSIGIDDSGCDDGSYE